MYKNTCPTAVHVRVKSNASEVINFDNKIGVFKFYRYILRRVKYDSMYIVVYILANDHRSFQSIFLQFKNNVPKEPFAK